MQNVYDGCTPSKEPDHVSFVPSCSSETAIVAPATWLSQQSSRFVTRIFAMLELEALGDGWN